MDGDAPHTCEDDDLSPLKGNKILCIENKWAYFGKVKAYKKKRGVVRSPTFTTKTTYLIFD